MSEEPIEKFSLFRKGILDELADEQSFVQFMLYNYNFISNRIQCEVELSGVRLAEAHGFWREDLQRTLVEGIPKETLTLDHFKQASFLAFWLRRMVPINRMSLTHPKFANATPHQVAERGKFLRYGNEIVALLIGFQVCLNYECAKIYPGDASNVHPILGARKSYLEAVGFPQALLSEYAIILKHKNMSPHAMYLLYKSLFTEPRARAA